MTNCWFCYKPVANADYHPACAKKFFGTASVPNLQLNDALLDALARQTVNKRIAVTGVQPKLSVTQEKTGRCKPLDGCGSLGRIHFETAALPVPTVARKRRSDHAPGGFV